MKGEVLNFDLEYPPATRGKIVVWGLMANSPFGGMVWQVYHYLVPLRQLGFDVWYVEDTDEFLYAPQTYMPTWDPTENVQLLDRFMAAIGLSDRWVVRRPNTNECFGALDYRGLQKLYREANAALNLCGAQEPREDHNVLRCRIYVETDPVRNQVSVANGDPAIISLLAPCDHLFTYGENLGDEDCLVPMERFSWKKTRPPVCPEWWNTDAAPGPDAALTSIANWKHKGKDVVWKDEIWRWSKHHEFLKFIDIPSHAQLPIELSVGAIDEQDRRRLKEHGWRTKSSSRLEDPAVYRHYIQQSLGEFTVAKEQYIAPRSGWFSDRSVCYLAAGRPVVTQDTAFGKRIPTGEGLFAYSNREQALAAIEAIATNYHRHSEAAREIGREYFGADRVIADMLRQVGLL